MIEQIKYINHRNEVIEFGKAGLYVNESDLHNFAWSVTSKNNKISGFKKGIVSKTIPLVIKCATDAQGLAMRNRIFEVMEKDVLAVKHGRLVIGDYYLKCFAVESKKSDYSINNGYMKISLKISTDFPYWIKEKTVTFGYGSGGSEGTNLDFNRDFPSDYTSNMLGQALNNADFVESNFIINIYGAAENPSVVIAGHTYEVGTSIAANEYLTIDSTNKTVILTHTDGSTTNCFNLRNKDSYIFQKIPSGLSNVSASGGFKFDVILLEERSEPKWT